jgi:hypothetical protein
MFNIKIVWFIIMHDVQQTKNVNNLDAEFSTFHCVMFWN